MKLKKLLFAFILAFIALFTVACGEEPQEVEEISLIAPTGTPSLIISKAIVERGKVNHEIVQGADALKAAFIKGEKDIIVAPVNLGAMMLANNETFNYEMVNVIVWCNYYVASTTELASFKDLDGKDIVVFGQNSTPDVVFRSLVAYHQITPNVTYVASVADANGMLMSNKADIIVTAEPALTVLLSKKNVNVLSLKDAWSEMVGGSNYDVPQAAVFVNKNSVEKCKSFLEKVVKVINEVKDNKEEVVAAAKSIDANLTNEDKLYIDALDRCNYKIYDNQKDSIEKYFQKVIDLGLGKTVGGKLPDEAFYYSK